MIWVVSWAIWWGGLTFYATVVIPTAHEILGTHLDVGFITREVTNWINGIASGALLVMLVNCVIARSTVSRRLGIALWITWAIMAAAQVILLWLHPRLDAMLDPQVLRIVDRAGFYSMHRVYLIVTAFQWLVAVAHLPLVLRGWRKAVIST